MRVSDILSRCSGQTMEHLTAVSGMRKAWDRHGDRLEALARALTSRAYLERQLGTLKVWESEVVRVCVRSFACMPFGLDELQQRAVGISGAHLKAALIRLQHKGVLFGLRKTWGEEVYLLPEEALPVWHELLFGATGEEEESWAVDGYEPEEEDGCGLEGILAEDLLQVFVFAAKHELALTRKGTIPKPLLRKLEAVLRIRDEDLAGIRLHSRYDGEYGPCIATLLDLGLQLGILTETEGRLTVNRQALNGLLRMPRRALAGKLYRLWSRKLRPFRPAELHAMFRLEQFTPGKWYLLEKVFDWLVEYGMIDEINREDLASVRISIRDNLLYPMQALGWIRLSRASGSGVLIRLNAPLSEAAGDRLRGFQTAQGYEAADGPQKTGFFVQSDFDVVVPPGAPLAILWELEAIAERISRDGAAIYRLTPEAVGYALENGRTAESILDFLETHARFPLPAHVKDALEQWAARYSAVTLQSVILLRCRDKATASLIEKHPGCRALLDQQADNATFIVLSGKAESLILELEGLGFHPCMGGGVAGGQVSMGYPTLQHNSGDTGPDAPESMAGPSGSSAPDLAIDADQGILIPLTPDPVYSPVPIPVDSDSGEWRSIPPMWWKEFRSYHASTQKEMVRTAIERQTVLRLRSKQEEYELIPRDLQETKEFWAVEGWRGRTPVTVREGEWQEMKLIIPGINDDA